MEIKDYLPAVGWGVTFLLGIISGGLIIPRLLAKRKLLAWTASESDLIPKRMSEVAGIPISIRVGKEEILSLSVVTLHIGNVGNDVVEKFTVNVQFNPECKVLAVRIPGEIGAYQDKIKWKVEGKIVKVDFDFINTGSSFEFEYILAAYEPGAVDVDCAAPNVVIKRQSGSRLQAELTKSLLGVSWGMLGFSVKYDPTAAAMKEVAEEIRGLRRQVREVYYSTGG